MFSALTLGIIGLLIGIYAEWFLTGVFIYWAGFFAMLGLVVKSGDPV